MFVWLINLKQWTLCFHYWVFQVRLLQKVGLLFNGMYLFSKRVQVSGTVLLYFCICDDLSSKFCGILSKLILLGFFRGHARAFIKDAEVIRPSSIIGEFNFHKQNYILLKVQIVVHHASVYN